MGIKHGWKQVKHIRTSKKGNRFKAGSGIKKINPKTLIITAPKKGYIQFNNKQGNQIILKNPIYLGNPLIHKTVREKTPVTAYTEMDNPQHIFISDFKHAEKMPIKNVAEVISHEELHNILRKDVGKEASKGLDRITIPSIINKKREIINPKTVGNIAFRLEMPKIIKREIKIYNKKR